VSLRRRIPMEQERKRAGAQNELGMKMMRKMGRKKKLFPSSLD